MSGSDLVAIGSAVVALGSLWLAAWADDRPWTWLK